MRSEIKESFLITEEDYIDMCLSRQKYMIPKENKIILAVMGIIAILCGTAAFINIRGNVYQIICWFLLIGIGLYVLSYYEVINPLITKDHAVKFFRYNQKLINSKTFTINSKTFSMTDQMHCIKIPIRYIDKIVESKTTLLIFTSKEEFTFVPKRALSKEQINIIRSMIAEEKYVRLPKEV
ncbi:MAG: YcxB family protein [Clostridia bacterium]|nr:YcxB family protein [Clostridia bacterium]